ncbi:PDZ domain-containing protein [Sphingosinithalassobacter sp. CS137]|uniref:PDZ domain-containing protein n=1 Tax=Sphingosinithalassobacter sp. CS137 TaxID=2762748 RepID=UPI00165E80D2|nr:PDZ domain-containing protein [Sphingosinithalassobacter sp. CS137]
MASGTEVIVVQLFDDSAAERAGLELGDQVLAIDDRELSAGGTACETMRWLIESRPERSAGELTVLRQGQRVTIDVTGR